MIGNQPFIKPEKQLLVSGLVLLIFSFFYQLGIYPLFLEEPRRGLIALEMIFQDNYWVPTQTGDLYFRKPPVYNWVLIAAYNLFGSYSEFATRFFSVFSHLILCGLTYSFVKKHLSQMAAILVSISLLISADILFYFSTLGEIDLFYALVTSSSLFAIYSFGEKKQYWRLFITVYLLTAIGFLTKGLTSLPFTAITLLVYFIHKKNFKKLLSLQHFTGVGLFALISGGYFYIYSQYHDVSGWWTTLFSESADKATGGIVEFLNHLVSFPVDTLKNILPAGLLLPLLFGKGAISKLRANRFVWYCVLVFAFNFLIYWFSAEAKSRYIYPLFPFVIIPLIYLAIQSSKIAWEKFIRITSFILLSILTIALPILFFREELNNVENLNLTVILMLVLLGILWFLIFTKKARPYLIVFGLMAVMKFGFSSIVPVTREVDTGAARDKALGIEIARLTEGEELHRIGNLRMSLTIVFYLERARKEAVYQTDSYESGFYFCYEKDLPKGNSYKLHKQFKYWEDTIYLIELD